MSIWKFNAKWKIVCEWLAQKRDSFDGNGAGKCHLVLLCFLIAAAVAVAVVLGWISRRTHTHTQRRDHTVKPITYMYYTEIYYYYYFFFERENIHRVSHDYRIDRTTLYTICLCISTILYTRVYINLSLRMNSMLYVNVACRQCIFIKFYIMNRAHGCAHLR